MTKNSNEIDNLVAAVIAGDIAQVRDMLPLIEIDSRASNGLTPLVAAGLYGHHKIAAYLVEQGAGLTVESDMGVPPQWFAAMGFLDLLEHSLNNGVEASSDHGVCALKAAVRCEQSQALRLIASRLNPLVEAERVHLHEALRCAHSAAMIDLLIDLGASPTYILPGGKTVLQSLAGDGWTEACLRLIEHGAPISTQGPAGSALFSAVTFGKAETMLALLQAGADPHARSLSGETLEAVVARSNSQVKQAYGAWRARQAIASAISLSQDVSF